MIEVTREMVQLIYERINFVDHDDSGIREGLAAVLHAHQASLRDALSAIERCMATDSRDWGLDRGDAWLWAALVGWDCEDDHDHEYEACSLGAFDEVATRHGWTAAQRSNVREIRHVVRQVTEGTP